MNSIYEYLGKVRPTAEGDWDIRKEYSMLSIVYDADANKSYISKKDVPINTSILNREYWQPFANNRIDSDSIVLLSNKKDNGYINSYTLEEAINNISVEDRRIGMFISFYEKPNSESELYRWNLYQFNSNNIDDWNDVTAWSSIYYNKTKFYGLQLTEEALINIKKNPDVGDYAYVGETLKDAVIYKCINKNIWTPTTEKAIDYVTVILNGNITVGSNGNWFENGIDTGIKAVGPKGDKGDSIKGDPGKSPIMRLDKVSGYVQYGYDGISWNNIIPIGDFIVNNKPDDEDITSENDKLKFADRSYSSELFSGKGYKILRKNISDGKNILIQEMINNLNTIYEIRYDYDLNGEEITIPENCILKFNGGSLSNGTLKGTSTTINTADTKIFESTLILGGTFKNPYVNCAWYGTDVDEKDNGVFINLAISNASKISKTAKLNDGTYNVITQIDILANMGLKGTSKLYTKIMYKGDNTAIYVRGQFGYLSDIFVTRPLGSEDSSYPNRGNTIGVKLGERGASDNEGTSFVRGEIHNIMCYGFNRGLEASYTWCSNITNITTNNNNVGIYTGATKISIRGAIVEGNSIGILSELIEENSIIYGTSIFDAVIEGNTEYGVKIEGGKFALYNGYFEANGKAHICAGIEKKVSALTVISTGFSSSSYGKLIIDKCDQVIWEGNSEALEKSITSNTFISKFSGNKNSANEILINSNKANVPFFSINNLIHCVESDESSFWLFNFWRNIKIEFISNKLIKKDNRIVAVRKNERSSRSFIIRILDPNILFVNSDLTICFDIIAPKIYEYTNNVKLESLVTLVYSTPYKEVTIGYAGSRVLGDKTIKVFIDKSKIKNQYEHDDGQISYLSSAYITINLTEDTNTDYILDETKDYEFAFKNMSIYAGYIDNDGVNSFASDFIKSINVLNISKGLLVPQNNPNQGMLGYSLVWDNNLGKFVLKSINSEKYASLNGNIVGKRAKYFVEDGVLETDLDTNNKGDYSYDVTKRKIAYWGGNKWYDSLGNDYNAATRGTTEQRPTDVKTGFFFFDTTLNKPIWKTSTGWVDATGADV